MRGFGAASFRHFGPLGPRRPLRCEASRSSSSSSSTNVQVSSTSWLAIVRNDWSDLVTRKLLIILKSDSVATARSGQCGVKSCTDDRRPDPSWRPASSVFHPAPWNGMCHGLRFAWHSCSPVSQYSASGGYCPTAKLVAACWQLLFHHSNLLNLTHALQLILSQQGGRTTKQASFDLREECDCVQRLPGQSKGFDGVRAARMGGFGFAFYGPYQHFWYKYLDKLFPTKSVPHFASKVCSL